jgi:hypothetical protein
MDKGNFVSSLDSGAIAGGTANGTDDGSLDFDGTVLSSELPPSLVPTHLRILATLRPLCHL